MAEAKRQSSGKKRSEKFDAATDEQVAHHENRRKNRGAAKTMQLNLTSMIDIIFLLLIYFVVTATFAIDEGVITATLPGGPPPPDDVPDPKEPLEIILTSFDQAGVRIGVGADAPGSFAELGQLLQTMQFNEGNSAGVYKDDHPVVIKPDGTVRWQHVVNAFNQAVRAKYKNVSFAATQ